MSTVLTSFTLKIIFSSRQFNIDKKLTHGCSSVNEQTNRLLGKNILRGLNPIICIRCPLRDTYMRNIIHSRGFLSLSGDSKGHCRTLKDGPSSQVTPAPTGHHTPLAEHARQCHDVCQSLALSKLYKRNKNCIPYQK
jgi:hypothetical protein